MASTRLKETKDGKQFYEISVSRGRGLSCSTMRWYVPEGWSKRSVERELVKVSADFETRCKSGEFMRKSDIKQAEEEKRIEEAKIKTVKQYGNEVYMLSVKVTCSESTRDGYQRGLDNWIYPVIGNLKIIDVTTAELNSLLLKMQSSGKSHSTCIKAYAILNQLFKMAYNTDVIEKNPMDKVDRPKAKKSDGKDRKIKAFNEDEIIYIMDCLDKEPLKWRTYFRLLIDTGIRKGEACGLKWENVDFKNNTITIAHSLNYTHGKPYLDTPKSGKTRTIDIDDSVAELMRELRAEQSGKAISQFVFSEENSSNWMNPQSPTQYATKFGKKYGIDDFHPHKLRHSFASIALTNGADCVTISEILGHYDPSVTLRMYAHSNEEARKKASETFRSAIKARQAQ